MDFQGFGQDVLQVIEEYGLPIDNFALSLTLDSSRFNALFAQHPRLIGGRVVEERLTINGLQGSIQIVRRLEVQPKISITITKVSDVKVLMVPS